MKRKKLLLSLLLAGVAACMGVGAFAGCSNSGGKNPGTNIDNPDVPKDETPDSQACTHTHFDRVAAVDATCTENGNKEYWYCSDCKKYYEDGYALVEISLAATIVAPHGHNYGELIKGVEATCDKAGRIDHYHCDACDTYFDAEKNELEEAADIVIAAGHNFEFVDELAATCTDNGVQAHYHCDACNQDFDQNRNPVSAEQLVIPASGNAHKFGKWVAQVDSTCSENGTAGHYECEICHGHYDKDGVRIEDLTLQLAPHSLGGIIAEVKATCDTDGVRAHIDCSECHKHFDLNGNEITDLTIAAAHRLGEWIAAKDATCTTAGFVGHYECEICHKYYGEDKNELKGEVVIPAHGHEYGEYEYDYAEMIYKANCVRKDAEKTQYAGVVAEFPYLVRNVAELNAAIVKGGHIKLMADINADVVIEQGKEVTLNLNGYTLSNEKSHTITNNGTVTIMGGGKLYNGTHKKSPLYNVGVATVNGITLQRPFECDEAGKATNSYYVIDNLNGGVMTIIDATVLTTPADTNTSLIRNLGATMTIESGEFNSPKKICIKNDDEGILTINGGTFHGEYNQTVQNWGTATINGGTFNGDVTTAIWSKDYSSQTTINGGTFSNLRIIYHETSKSEVSPIIKVANNVTVSTPIIQISKGTSSGYSIATEKDGIYTVFSLNRPTLISSEAEWVKFAAEFAELSVDKNDTYYKITSDLDFSEVTDRVDVYCFSGTIDFDGHKVRGVNAENTVGKWSSATALFILLHDATILNLDYEITYLGEPGATARPVLHAWRGEVTLENVTVSGAVTYAENNASAFVYFVWSGAAAVEGAEASPVTLTFKDCVSKTNITNTGASKTSGYVSAFVGRVVGTGHTVNFINCVNEGTITGYHNASMLIANPYAWDNNLTVENCVNKGTIYAGLNVTPVLGYHKDVVSVNEQYGANVTNAEGGVMETIDVKALEVNEDGNFVIDQVEGATKYTLSFVFSAAQYDENGKELQHGTSNITVDVTPDMQLKKLDFVVGEKGVVYNKNEAGLYVTENGENYVFGIDGQGTYGIEGLVFKAQPTAYLTVYGADGNVLSVSTLSY